MLAMIALAAALASPAPQPSRGAVAAVARERAFADAARERGIAAAFLDFVDEGAVRLTPEPEPALAYWKARPNRVGPPYLEWRPTWAAGSRCGHLAFTLGPYRYGDLSRGYYFTVWSDRGSSVPLKWMLDAGLELASAPPVTADAPVDYAAPATGRWRAHHMDTYEGQIARRDEALNAALAQDPAPAYAGVLAPDARALGPAPQALAIGRTAALAQLRARPSLTARHRSVINDFCGDLGFSYGVADWADGSKTVKGNYVRVWRRAGERWTLLFDELSKPD